MKCNTNSSVQRVDPGLPAIHHVLRNCLFRSVSLILACSVVLSSFVAPASAAEISNSWLNVLDYSSADGAGSNWVQLENGSASVYYSLPDTMPVYGVDLIFYAEALSASVASGDVNFTVTPLGTDGYFRAFGDLCGAETAVLPFTFNISGASSLSIMALTASPLSVSSYVETGTAHVIIWDGDYEDTYEMTSILGNNTVTIPGDNFGDGGAYYIFAFCENWREYDYLDFQFNIMSTEVSSVSAMFGNLVLPAYVSQNESGGNSNGPVFMTIRVDIRGLDRTTEDYPQVIIAGMRDTVPDRYSNFQFMNCAGVVELHTPDPDLTWYERIYTAIVNGFNTLGTRINLFATNVGNWFTQQIQAVNSGFTSVGQWFTDLGTSIGNWFTQQIQAVNDFASSVSQWFTDLGDNISSWFSRLLVSVFDNSSNNNLFDFVEIGDKFTGQMTLFAGRGYQLSTGSAPLEHKEGNLFDNYYLRFHIGNKSDYFYVKFYTSQPLIESGVYVTNGVPISGQYDNMQSGTVEVTSSSLSTGLYLHTAIIHPAFISSPDYIFFAFRANEPMTVTIQEVRYASLEGDHLKDSIQQAGSEMEAAGDALESVNKPSVDDIDPSLDNIVSQGDIASAGSVLGGFFDNSFVLSVLLMVCTLSMVSYLLYGKR